METSVSYKRMENVVLAENSNPIINENVDYSRKIYDSLPSNAKKYFKEKSSLTLDQIVSQLNTGELVKKYVSMLSFCLLIPMCYIKYANANQLLPVLMNGKHRLLKGPILHWQTGITDKVGKPVEISNDVIFGSIKLVYVNPGCLKYALNTETSSPLLLGPGIHYFDDNSIIVDENEIILNSDGENKVIPIGKNKAFSFIFVKIGSQGIVNTRDGTLKTLDPGLHFIESPDNFAQFVSVQQEHFKFGSCDKGIPIFLTADNVELHVDATLFYSISDVKKVYTTTIKNNNDLYETLHSQAMATLMTIVRSENFSNIGKRKMDPLVDSSLKGIQSNINKMNSQNPIPLLEVEAVQITPSAPPLKSVDTLNDVTIGFQSIIHDAEPRFKETMQQNFGNRVGINIQSLRIEKIEFADKIIQKQVSELAMTYTKLSAQEATISAQRKVEVAQAERESATAMIKARAEAERKMVAQENENEISMKKIKIQNDILLQSTNAEMEASKLKTATDAQNKIKLANAEAQSILEIGNAEVEIIKKKNELPNAQLRIVADAQTETLKGVQKVIYTDKQPLLMQSLTTLNESIPINWK